MQLILNTARLGKGFVHNGQTYDALKIVYSDGREAVIKLTATSTGISVEDGNQTVILAHIEGGGK